MPSVSTKSGPSAAGKIVVRTKGQHSSGVFNGPYVKAVQRMTTQKLYMSRTMTMTLAMYLESKVASGRAVERQVLVDARDKVGS